MPDNSAEPVVVADETQSTEIADTPKPIEDADVTQSSEIAETPEPVEDTDAFTPAEIAPPEPDTAFDGVARFEQIELQTEEIEPPVIIKEPRRLPRAEREKYDRQRRYFSACGRCGYFVADCCLFLGEEAVQDAILDADDGWVRLEGDETFRRLLQNAYGIQLDIGYEYFDGACPECRRRFVFIEQSDVPTRLKIQLSKPY